jgi:hypothetical protein
MMAEGSQPIRFRANLSSTALDKSSKSAILKAHTKTPKRRISSGAFSFSGESIAKPHQIASSPFSVTYRHQLTEYGHFRP